MRVYLPATVPALARARERGLLDPGLAHAVTPAVREWYVDDDVEDLELTALLDAARSSLALLGEDPDAPRLRLVVAADVPDGEVSFQPGGGRDHGSDAARSAVSLAGPVPLKSVISLHIDEPSAQRTIAAAIIALPAADSGDEDAEFEVSQAEGCDLLWYDITELDDLIG
jgi:hypothetical protein